MKNDRGSRSIIVQVAILFAVCVMLTGILTYITQFYKADSFVLEETLERSEMVSREAKAAVYEYPAYKWLLRYWYKHAEEMDIEYDVEYTSAGTKTEEKCRVLSEKYPDLELKYATEKEIKALPPEDQKLYAEIVYSWLITRLDQIKRVYKPSYLYCVASVPPYDNQFFVFSAADKYAERGTEYGQVYTIGVSYDVEGSVRDAMTSAIRNNAQFSESNNFIDYYSYLYGYDKVEMLIGLTFDETELMSNVKELTVVGSVSAMVYQILLSAIMSICIYFLVLKPLKKVQASIRAYKDTKDSAEAEKELSEVHAKNEIGELASDVSDLTKEIDDYLEEISVISAEKERLGAELAVAHQIQASRLPHEFPAFPDRNEIDLFASMTPAKEVGGDFYDFALIDDDHLYLVMADVSGKGIPAALFMMASMIILASNAKQGKTPAEILRSSNESICRNNHEEMFVTVWCGILELSSGKLIAANAGHEYPMIKKPDGSYELIRDKHGFVLGGMPDLKYTDYELTLEPGSKLFLYTDGIPEATNENNEMFGTDRMLDALNSEPEARPADVLMNMNAFVAAFVGEAEQFDDMTMLCLEYKGHGEQK